MNAWRDQISNPQAYLSCPHGDERPAHTAGMLSSIACSMSQIKLLKKEAMKSNSSALQTCFLQQQKAKVTVPISSLSLSGAEF